MHVHPNVKQINIIMRHQVIVYKKKADEGIHFQFSFIRSHFLGFLVWIVFLIICVIFWKYNFAWNDEPYGDGNGIAIEREEWPVRISAVLRRYTIEREVEKATWQLDEKTTANW
jgi:hypothetical protein